MSTELPVLGSYVSYKNSTYLVVGIPDGPMILSIMDPTAGQRKLQVCLRSIKLLPYTPAKIINHNGCDYIVTARHNIISIKTKRLMLWPANHGLRINILALADINMTEAEFKGEFS